MTDDVFWIWSQIVFGVGTRRATLLMEYFSHPRQIYEGVQKKSHVTGMLTAQELAVSEDGMERALRTERLTLRKGCEIITPQHPDYPPLLLDLPDRPAALYCKGELRCLQAGLAIAMVGTRKHSEYGGRAAAFFAEGLARAGAVVVSGLAPGIDTESHRAALEAGGKTVGVLGCGIDIDYPRQSRTLKTAVSESGAVVTEFPLGTEPYPGNFPMRNRLISGMSHGTVVVEADKNSGSLITARLAKEQGREVFAVPGSIFQQGGAGANRLLKEGARAIDCLADLAAVYPQLRAGTQSPQTKPGAKPPTQQKLPRPKPLPEGVSETASSVYAVFEGESLTVEEIVSAAGLATGDVLSALTELEIYGLLESYPGRRFGLSL